MKKILLIVLFSIISIGSAKACSCGGEAAFCDVNFNNPTHHVFIGKILQHDSLSSTLEIVEKLRGIELADTITIWDYNDTILPGIACSSTAANSIGTVGDSILIILGKIIDTSIYNPHAVIGDYYAPSRFCATPTIGIRNGIIIGNITKTHLYTSPLTPYIIDSISINNFKANFNTAAGIIDCDLFVGLQENQKETELAVSPNPFQNYIQINSQVELTRITIVDLLGEIVYNNTLVIGNRINLDQLQSGIFFITVETKSGEQISKKLIKN